MVQFLGNKTGLREAHQGEDPLFEKKYVLPESEKKLVSRLYPDGSLYYLTDREEVPRGEKIRAAWNLVSTVHEDGARQVKEKLQQCCREEFSAEDPEDIPGTTSWRFFCGGKLREVIIKGTPEGKATVFLEIDHLISSMMDKIP